MFLKRKPKITFKATIPGLEDAWPIVPISEVKPQQRPKNNMNVCPGIMDLNRSGYVIRAWSEIFIEKDADGLVRASVNDRDHDMTLGKCTRMDAELLPFHYSDKTRENVLKIELPWLVETAPGYSCMQLSPFYHFLDMEPHIINYPGIVDTDGLHRLSWIFSVKHDEPFIIERGTPIMHLIPYRRENFTSEVSRAEVGDWMRQKLKMSMLLPKWYLRNLHSKKSYK